MSIAKKITLIEGKEADWIVDTHGEFDVVIRAAGKKYDGKWDSDSQVWEIPKEQAQDFFVYVAKRRFSVEVIPFGKGAIVLTKEDKYGTTQYLKGRFREITGTKKRKLKEAKVLKNAWVIMVEKDAFRKIMKIAGEKAGDHPVVSEGGGKEWVVLDGFQRKEDAIFYEQQQRDNYLWWMGTTKQRFTVETIVVSQQALKETYLGDEV